VVEVALAVPCGDLVFVRGLPPRACSSAARSSEKSPDGADPFRFICIAPAGATPCVPACRELMVAIPFRSRQWDRAARTAATK